MESNLLIVAPNENPENDELDDLADLISRAESIIEENRERMRRNRRDSAESIREQALALLREPLPVLEVDLISEVPAIESSSLRRTSFNRTLNESHDVIFVACEQAPPSHNAVIDLSTPEYSHNKRTRRRTLQHHNPVNNDEFIEVVDSPNAPVENSVSVAGAANDGGSDNSSRRGVPTVSCAICLDECRKPTSTLCGHIFCEKCIKAAIKTSHKCPLCKRKLSPKAIHPLYF